MTEQEWVSWTGDPGVLLDPIRDEAKGRKLRLFACACCRRIWNLLTDKRSRWAVDTAELFAEGHVDEKDLSAARTSASAAHCEEATRNPFSTGAHAAASAFYAVAASPICTFASANRAASSVGSQKDTEQRVQSSLFRCIFGNHFRAVILDLTWLTSKAVSIAQRIYDSLAFDRLLTLADTLEEAGCDNAEILDHCRGPGPHVRGCWVVDVILRKGVAMTEAEWGACTNPLRILEHLGKDCSKRKLRLFIADGVKTLASIFGSGEVVLADMHERVAEGLATEEDLERYLLRDMPELWEHRAPGGNLPSVWATARTLVRDRFKLAPLDRSEIPTEASRAAEYDEMCRVLRCIFGNPFRPVTLDPSWRTPSVVNLAEAIYEHRAFDCLPLLAGALEEVGCRDAELLAHCRGAGPHLRGCWALDLVLEKE